MKRRILPALLLGLSVVVVAPSCEKDKPQMKHTEVPPKSQSQKAAEEKAKKAEEAMKEGEKKLGEAQEKLKAAEKAKMEAEKALQDAKKANRGVEEAEKRLKEAEKKLENAQKENAKTKEELEKLKKELDDAKKALQDAQKGQTPGTPAPDPNKPGGQTPDPNKPSTPQSDELKKAEEALRLAEEKRQKAREAYNAKSTELDMAKKEVNSDPAVKAAADKVKELINTPEIKQFWEGTGGAHRKLRDGMQHTEQALKHVREVENLMGEIDGLIEEKKWKEVKEKLTLVQQKAKDLFESTDGKGQSLNSYTGKADYLMHGGLAKLVDDIVKTPPTTTQEGAIENLKKAWSERKWNPEDAQLKAEREKAGQFAKDAKQYLSDAKVDEIRNGIAAADRYHGQGDYSRMLDRALGLPTAAKASSSPVAVPPSLNKWEKELQAERKLIADAVREEGGAKPLYDAMKKHGNRLDELQAELERIGHTIEEALVEIDAAKKRVEELKAKGK